MKRFLTSICLLFVITIAADATSLSAKMNRYLDTIENVCSEWTKKDWNLSKSEYKAFVEEYKANRDTYSQEEKEAINIAIGRYNGLLIKHGMEDLGESIKDFGERIPSFLEGFKSAFEKK